MGYYYKEYRAKYRAAKVALGMCPVCMARPPIAGMRTCQKCLDRARRNSKQYRKTNKDRVRLTVRKWRKKNKERNKAIFDRHYRKMKRLVFAHYGSKCSCCGEREEFLTLDHINGDGGKHRKKLGMTGGFKFYPWVVKSGFPDYLQSLCWNCNLAKHLYKSCPHKWSKEKRDAVFPV